MRQHNQNRKRRHLRRFQGFTTSMFLLGATTPALMAQTMTVMSGEVSNVGNTTVEMLTVEAGGTLNVIPSANFNLTGSMATTIDNSGVINTNTASDFQFARGVSNSGAINVDSGMSASPTDIEVAADTTLTGGGTITLSGANAGITGAISGVDLDIDGQTIQGQGALGRNTIDIINSSGGVIDANVGGQTLVIDAAAGGLTNAGTIEATNGGTLEIDNTVVNNAGGTITAQTGSNVLLDGTTTINGGTISSVDTGEVRTDVSSNVFLNGVTNTDSLVVGNVADLGIEGTITNSGEITFDSTVFSPTDIEVQTPGATLTGGGTVTLSGSNAGINGGGTLTIGNQTIQGAGSLGRNTIDITNTAEGTILANVDGEALVIDVSTIDFSNDGSLGVDNGALLQIIGDLDSSDTSTLFGEGTITASGGDILHSGLIAPDDSLVLDANVLLDSDSEIQIDIGALGFDVLSVTDDLTLDGLLSLSLLDGFTPDALDTFEIITSGSLAGSFANVTNGGILQTTDGLGAFTVNFGPGSGLGANQVVLSSFSAIPEPASASLLMMGGMTLLMRRRRI